MKGVRDPLERARLCQQFLDNGERTLDQVRVVRDDAIRAERARNPLVPRNVLAESIGVRLNVVVDALRVKR